MNFREQFDAMLTGPAPILALAPMQEVTDWAFWKLMAAYGGADVYFTEYFRVHATSNLEKPILKSIEDNPTGRPVVAQMIGNDIPSLVRTARELQKLPIVAVDLNLGCPAPIVYKKCAGGGLLREPERVDAILGALREAVTIKFSVKTRLGFDSSEAYDQLLPIFARHSIDLLTVHARTVKEMYRSEVHYEFITQTVQAMRCPVLANGNICSAQKAEDVLAQTGARGLMIGRGAIRNPWMFQQIRDHLSGKPPFVPSGHDVLGYIRVLWDHSIKPETRESSQIMHMKRFMNFIGLGVDAGGRFLYEIRRAKTKAEFFGTCESFLDHDRPTPLEPFKLELKETDLLAGVHH